VSKAQGSLLKAQAALNTLLGSAAGNPGTAPGTGSAPSGNGSPQQSQSQSQPSPTAEELVAYQAAVDAAAADVGAAQQALAQATIVSPIAGTVAAVDLAAGDAVTASSATNNIVVVGTHGFEVTTTVSVSDVTKLKVGDVATIVADGTTKKLPGKVVSIGVTATTDGTTASYPVVVGFTTAPAALRNGASASVSMEVGRSGQDALTVPTSALRTTNGTHTVTVLANGKTSTVRVELGAVGAVRTEVKSGLQAGQVVVLADLSAPLPSSDASSRIANRFGGGGLQGGGGLGR
jgi:RND family efflux transporter MFP subunit